MHISLQHSTVIFTPNEEQGVRIQGWSDGDGLTLPDITVAETVVGADGKLMAQATGDQGGEVVLTLLPLAETNQQFLQRMSQIVLGDQTIWNASVDYGPLGGRVRMSNGVLVSGPVGLSLGKGSAAARVWTFMFETIRPSFDNANFTGPPPIPAAANLAAPAGG